MEDWVGQGKRGAAVGLAAERGGGSSGLCRSREQAWPNSLTPASATTAPGHRLAPTHPAWSLPTRAHGVYGTGGTLLRLGAP